MALRGWEWLFTAGRLVALSNLIKQDDFRAAWKQAVQDWMNAVQEHPELAPAMEVLQVALESLDDGVNWREGLAILGMIAGSSDLFTGAGFREAWKTTSRAFIKTLQDDPATRPGWKLVHKILRDIED